MNLHKQLTKEERSKMMSELAKKRWAGIDAKGRSDYARKMLQKRWKTKS